MNGRAIIFCDSNFLLPLRQHIFRPSLRYWSERGGATGAVAKHGCGGDE